MKVVSLVLVSLSFSLVALDPVLNPAPVPLPPGGAATNPRGSPEPGPGVQEGGQCRDGAGAVSGGDQR